MSRHVMASQGLELGAGRRLHNFVSGTSAPIISSCQQFPWRLSCVPPPRGLGSVLLALGASLVLASLATTAHLFRAKEHEEDKLVDKQDKLVPSQNQKLEELVSYASSDEESKLDLMSILERPVALQHYDEGNGPGVLSTSHSGYEKRTVKHGTLVEEESELPGNMSVEVLEKKLKVENEAGQIELTERDVKLKNGMDVLEQEVKLKEKEQEVEVKERVVIVAPEVALAAAFVNTALKNEFFNQVIHGQHLLHGGGILDMQPQELPETSENREESMASDVSSSDTLHMEDNLDTDAADKVGGVMLEMQPQAPPETSEESMASSVNRSDTLHMDDKLDTDASEADSSDSSQGVYDEPNTSKDIKELTYDPRFDKAEDTGVVSLVEDKSGTVGSNTEVIISEVFSVQGDTLGRCMSDSAKSLVLDDLEVFEKAGELGVPSTGSNKSELQKQLELLVVAAFALIVLGIPEDDDLAKAGDSQGRKGELTKVVQAAVPAVAIGAGAMSIITGVNGAFEMVGLAATASFIYFDLLYYESRRELSEEMKKIRSHKELVEFLRSKKIIPPEGIL